MCRGVAKPFIKWVGGKTQLIEQIDALLPASLKNCEIDTYIEPFVGGGALLFHILSKYKIQKAVIIDINKELINNYRCIKADLENVILELKKINIEYAIAENKEEFFYKVRTDYNQIKLNGHCDSVKCARFIFLNKTCFNGLYRVNSKGEFNVPFGNYKNPRILDEQNLIACSKLLQNCEIVYGGYEKCQKYINGKTFMYFDPPYRPLAKDGFTKYTKFDFSDIDQQALAELYKKLDKKNYELLLSNSDPKNTNASDNFFEDLYNGFSISRVKATRMINCQVDKRGQITEILVRNYQVAEPATEQLNFWNIRRVAI
jgi:DNA adenine methylase